MIELNVVAVELDQVVLDHAATAGVHGDAHCLIVVNPAIAHHVVIATQLEAVIARALHLEAINCQPVTFVTVADGMHGSADDDRLPLHFGFDHGRCLFGPGVLSRNLDWPAVEARLQNDSVSRPHFGEGIFNGGPGLLAASVVFRLAVGGHEAGCRRRGYRCGN